MRTVLKHGYVLHKTTLSHYSHLLDHCLSARSPNSVKSVHADLVKVGFDIHTFLGNRALDLYCQFGTVDDVLKVFDDIAYKNCISWNICLKGLFRFGCFEKARVLFDEMPDRDVVTWNSMMSGCLSYGLSDYALRLYLDMKEIGVKPNQHTFSILTLLALDSCHGMQIHGKMIQFGMVFSNVVPGNSLISMYGRLGLVDYAFKVFLSMVKVDIISWNALIWGCYRSGHRELALDRFRLMRDTTQNQLDQFTISTVLGVCCDERDLEKGTPIFAYCFKLGFLSNTIVLSAVIDLFSKCNRLENAVQLFSETDQRDSAVCNSMISGYATYDLSDNVMEIFVLMLRKDLKPTEFTFSNVLSSISGFLSTHQGIPIHSLVIKYGMDSDPFIASSLVQIYSKAGLIDSALKIFSEMVEKDLVSWNSIITGLAHNGSVSKALEIFHELLVSKSPCPDRITLIGVLSACNYGNLVEEGLKIFSSMEKEYGIIPDHEHYVSIVDLLSLAGRLKEAIYIMENLTDEPRISMWRSILYGSILHGDLKLAETVAKTMIELDPSSSFAYLALARAFELAGRWDNAIRVRKAMKRQCRNAVVDCSRIGVRNRVYTFSADQLLHHGGNVVYDVSKLLFWQMKMEGFV